MSHFRRALAAWRPISVAVAVVAVMSLQPLATSAQCVDDAMAPNVRQLLDARDFAALDELLTTTQDAYLEDYLKEPALDELLEEFNRFEDELTAPLDAWVEASASASAHLARGIHRMAIGWNRRGCALANQTSEEQFDAMREYFTLAVEDLSKSLGLEPEQTHVYGYLILIMMNFSADEQIEQAYREALALNPRSLMVRSAYLRSVQPRWGGSIPRMEAAVADARQYFEDYPALETLEAKMHAERGFMSLRAGDLPAVIRHYSAALDIAEECDYYEERGNAYMLSQQYESAVADFNESILLCPTDMLGYDFRGRTHYWAKDYERAAADLTRAFDGGRENVTMYQLRGDSYVRLKRYAEAKQDLARALELDPAADTEFFRDLRAWVDGRLRYEAECSAIPGCVPGP